VRRGSRRRHNGREKKGGWWWLPPCFKGVGVCHSGRGGGEGPGSTLQVEEVEGGGVQTGDNGAAVGDARRCIEVGEGG
jgi:hypothetical protein